MKLFCMVITALAALIGAAAAQTGLGQLAAGIDANVLNAQTANYAIASTDCGKTIQAGAGSTGFFTVTLPSVAGFAPICTVRVINGDTVRGKTLSGFPSGAPAILYPLQAIEVKIVNGACVNAVLPGRWRLPSGTTRVYINAAGSDSNDGLATGASGALATFAAAAAVLQNNLDLNGQTVAIQSDAGQTWTNSVLAGGFVGNGVVAIDGANSTFTGTTNVNNGAIKVTGNTGPTYQTTVVIQNMTITCSGGANGLSASSGLATVNTGVTFGACPGGNHIIADGPSRLSVIGGYSITGGASTHLTVTGAGEIDWNGAGTVTLTGTPAFSTAFANGDYGGQIISFVAYSGAATGTRFKVQRNSQILTGLTANMNYFPGNAAGTIASNGTYDALSPPGVSSCGTSPGTANGTDLFGNITEGTTATGCTLTFASASVFTACIAQLSSNTAVGITSLGATLVVNHASVSGNTLYWHCGN